MNDWKYYCEKCGRTIKKPHQIFIEGKEIHCCMKCRRNLIKKQAVKDLNKKS